uniref:SFRICE_033640 n=1 Tax=Spodoptera frugiperda TaxID=7108 RepID=A0A2H1WNR1_SPOFR
MSSLPLSESSSYLVVYDTKVSDTIPALMLVQCWRELPLVNFGVLVHSRGQTSRPDGKRSAPPMDGCPWTAYMATPEESQHSFTKRNETQYKVRLDESTKSPNPSNKNFDSIKKYQTNDKNLRIKLSTKRSRLHPATAPTRPLRATSRYDIVT